MKSESKWAFASIGALLIQMTVVADPIPVTGFLNREVFLNLAGSTLSDLTNSPKFINNQPDNTFLLTSFEAPVNTGSDYGQRLSGFLIPPTTGDYIFFIASDDQSELWLSSDDKSINKQLVATVTDWTGSREWNKYPETQSNLQAPIPLVAGKSYYIEAIMKQGGGGDNLAVGWVLPGQSVDPYNPPDGLANIVVIPGQNLRALLDAGSTNLLVMASSFTTMISDGADVPATGNGTDFGSFSVKSGSHEQTFTLYNTGTVPLDLPGNPRVSLTGPQASDFTVTSQPAASVAVGGSTSFTVRFDPSVPGPRKAILTIPRGDNPSNPFDFAIQGVGLGGGAGILGNDSEGVTWVPINDNQIHGNRFQSPRDMRISQIQAKLIELAGIFKCAVYADTNGVASRLLRSTVDLANATNGWNTLDLASPLDLTAGEFYWLVIWSDTSGARVQYDSTGSSFWGSYYFPELGGEWPDPIILIGGPDVRTYCLYAEGTPIGTVSGATINVRGNGKLIVSEDNTPSLLDGTDFGSTGIGSSSSDHTFVIQNPGDAALELSGQPLASVTGAHAGDFQIMAQPTSPVAPGASTQFTVRFRPTVRGLRTASISITNNSLSDNPYVFALQGAGYQTGRESIWPDTKTAKQWVENTDYELGMIFRSSVPGKITHLRVYSTTGERGDHSGRLWRNDDETVIGGPYTWNYGGFVGWITLDIPDVEIEAEIDYTVAVSTGSQVKNYPNIAADVSRGGGNGLHLTYPDNAGVFSTTLGERPTTSYNGGNYLRDVVFVPAGTVLDLPDMEVRANDQLIADGDTTPGSGDFTDFGQTASGGGSMDRSFTIRNTGTAPLNLSGAKKVAITGSHAADFSVVTQPASPIQPGSVSSFTIRFAPKAVGVRNAILSIENDSDKNPYDFAITGTGSAVALRFTGIKPDYAAGSITLQWTGDGQQFQVEKATTSSGPFQAIGSPQSERIWTDPKALSTNSQSFYRVRQISP